MSYTGPKTRPKPPPLIRRRPTVADEAEEIAPEDILETCVDTYLAPPPPALRTERMLPDLFDDPVLSSAPPPHVHVQETPSVAPVALASVAPLRPPFAQAPRAMPAIAAALVPLAAALATVVLVLVLGPRAKSAAAAWSDGVAPASADAPVVESPVPSPLPPPEQQPEPPTVAASELPAPPPDVPDVPHVIRAPGMARVTFPPRAKGHRVYVDGRLLPTGADPADMRCGRRSIKIGSAGTPRDVFLPCGGELSLP